jgi:hypothetical protein
VSLTETIARMMGARAVEAAPMIGLEVAPAAGYRIDPDDDLFRRITGVGRDLVPLALVKAQAISLKLWRENAMAHRLTEMIVDFVVGDGITFTAADDRVKDVLDEFWNDPRMDLALRHIDWVRDQSIYGELALRGYVNEQSGRARLGYLVSGRIDEVELNGEDALTDKTLWLRPLMGATRIGLPIVTWNDDDPLHPLWEGDAFYFPVNRITGQTRGTPDLLAIADYVDGYDQLLFNALERSGFLNAFVWDVTLKGQTPDQITAWLQKNGVAPAPGSVRAHNEAESWEAKSPSLGSADVVTIGREVKNMGLGGAGVPEGWFANGDNSNRAALSEQDAPTYRMLARRQLLTRHQWEKVLRWVVEMAKQHGRLPANVDTDLTVNMPDPSVKDVKGISTALPQVANALTAAIAEDLIDTKSARRVFLSVAGQMGVELDEETVEQAIEDAKAEKAAETPPPDPFADVTAEIDAAGLPPEGASLGVPPVPTA